jgi:hypothetical protein
VTQGTLRSSRCGAAAQQYARDTLRIRPRERCAQRHADVQTFHVKTNDAYSLILKHRFDGISRVDDNLVANANCVPQRQGVLDVSNTKKNRATLGDDGDAGAVQPF